MFRRNVCYVTGSRADFGLMVSTLRQLNAHPAISLSILVTGMHLGVDFGLTIKDVEDEGFRIVARVECDMSKNTASQMAKNIGTMLCGFVDQWEKERPDLVLLLGDRGEMLAGAIAATHLGIPVAHIHGGERSGTIDEPVRHAISKLAHLHLVASEDARDRLVGMGELSERIVVVGAPGLDGIKSMVSYDRNTLSKREGFDDTSKIALFIFHPVLHDMLDAGEQARCILKALLDSNFKVLALMPNADAGNHQIAEVLRSFERMGSVVIKTHLPRNEFISWMACVDIMVGNSSSGVIEAATFGTNVINVGTRQNMRLRNPNVIDVPVDRDSIIDALHSLRSSKKGVCVNLYGDGQAGKRIVDYLIGVTLNDNLLVKCNAY